MVNRATYWVSMIGTIVGLAVMLFGVYQTHGQSVNGPMIVGGLVALGALLLLTAGIIRVDADAAGH